MQEKFVTYDFARLMQDAHTVPTSTFGDALIAKITGNPADLARYEEKRTQILEQEHRDKQAN